MTAPSIGRIVHYKLNEAHADVINARGYRDDRGNDAHADQVLPMIIVRVWPDGIVNGQVFLDGDDTLWVTSVHEGEGRGDWAWPTQR